MNTAMDPPRPLLQLIGCLPALDERLETLFCWLGSRGLVEQGGVMDLPTVDLGRAGLLDGTCFALAESTARGHQVRRKKRLEMKALKDRHGTTVPGGVSPEAVWGAVKRPEYSVRTLNWAKLPADAMAFYRPFHYLPFDQWGIYLLVKPLLEYHDRLQQLAADLRLYSAEVLMHLVLFEVFNHEFFHHLAESTATFLEVLGAAQGEGKSVYLDFSRAQRTTGFDFPHAPLEEALANAYAHNALSFISRIKAGYKTAVISSYQEAIKAHWCLEPPGYREADHYIDGAYIVGGAHLLAQMFGAPEAVASAPLSCLAKHLMPNGFTALVQKPDIPTYLVGGEQDLAAFHALVPAPNEAYTQLFWPYDTKTFDDFVAKKLAEEKAAREARKKAQEARRAARHPGQSDLFETSNP